MQVQGLKYDGLDKPPKKLVDRNSKDGIELKKILTNELEKIHWLEENKVGILEKMIEQTQSMDLLLDLEDNFVLTKRKLDALQKVFSSLAHPAGMITNRPMQQLYLETEEIFQKMEKGIPKDAGILLKIQQLEYYEIATYGLIISIAKTISLNEIAGIVLKMLSDETDSLNEITKLGGNIADND